jgi:hypothetical protein
VEGSHSWLLADPDRFGEVITNDLAVARMARDLEAPAVGRRAARRPRELPTLDPDADVEPGSHEAAASRPLAADA